MPSEAVRRAVEHAIASGVLIVAAIGNHRIDPSALHDPPGTSCAAVPVFSFDGVLAFRQSGTPRARPVAARRAGSGGPARR